MQYAFVQPVGVTHAKLVRFDLDGAAAPPQHIERLRFIQQQTVLRYQSIAFGPQTVRASPSGTRAGSPQQCPTGYRHWGLARS